MKWFISVMLFAGCTLPTGNYAGKACDTNLDCPVPFVCAQLRPDGRTCELLRGVDTYDPSLDAPADYCHDVKPILDRTCVGTCHGTNMSYVGAPKTFRLDVYSTGTVILGAGAVAFDINNRFKDGSMPPPGEMPRPTDSDKAIILRWFNAGAPECFASDGG